MLDVEKLKPKPLGFGKCGKCAYLQSGTPEICFSCARTLIKPLPPDRCDTCDQALGDDGECHNPICSWDDRYFTWNYAIAMKSGVLEKAISRYKYEGGTGWALIFGRVLLGFLEANPRVFENFGLIIPSPTYTSESGPGRTWDHTRLVVQRADEEDIDDEWPFLVDDPVIRKTAATTRFVGKTWKQRHTIATTEVRGSLDVTRPEVVKGKSILVFDDIFTDGLNLNEVARALKEYGGAKDVCGVTLARAEYQRRS